MVYNHYDWEGWWMPKPIWGAQTPVDDPFTDFDESAPLNQDPGYANFPHKHAGGKDANGDYMEGWNNPSKGAKRPGDYIDNPKSGKTGKTNQDETFWDHMKLIRDAAAKAKLASRGRVRAKTGSRTLRGWVKKSKRFFKSPYRKHPNPFMGRRLRYKYVPIRRAPNHQ